MSIPQRQNQASWLRGEILFDPDERARFKEAQHGLRPPQAGDQSVSVSQDLT